MIETRQDRLTFVPSSRTAERRSEASALKSTVQIVVVSLHGRVLDHDRRQIVVNHSLEQSSDEFGLKEERELASFEPARKIHSHCDQECIPMT